MDADALQKAIVQVVREAFATNNSYPDGPAIYKALKKKQIDCTPEDVKASLKALEKEGILSRAPHYFVSG